ncbi:MAG: protein kinase [Saprospiraceae bacterium]|nr:protein kinase [Saprospiraceae bacterium]
MSIYTESKSFTQDFPDRIKFSKGDQLKLSNDRILMVESEIGEGGFGSVYKVRDNVTYDLFAVKVLEFFRMKPSETSQILRRFYDGYKAGLIPSDHLVHNLGSGFFGNNPYVIMDFCPNGNLSLQRNVYNSESKILNLASDLCSGLHDLHRHGYVHRDFKPENILFDSEMTAKLCDFDISGRYGLHEKRVTTVTPKGEVVEVWGTLAYSAPEQMDHREAFRFLGPQMDIFSLGVTLYELLTNGHLPFGTAQEIKDTPIKYTKRVKTKNFKPINLWRSDLSSKWIRFFELSLEPDPSKRISSIDQVIDLLQIESPIKSSVFQQNKAKNSLVIRSGDDVGKIFELEQMFEKSGRGVIRFGRMEVGNNYSDLLINENNSTFISRRHGTFEKVNGEIHLRDGQWDKDSIPPSWKFSLNGIYINGELLNKNSSHSLCPGDIITIGEVIMQYL